MPAIPASDRRAPGFDRAWLAALILTLSVLVTGWLAPDVMVGDELTHYYMMRGQQADWSQANFDARVPVQWDERGHHRRVYPHSNGWHFLVAAITAPVAGAVPAVQVVQALFFLQFLAAGILLLRSNAPSSSSAPLVWVLLAGSIPAVLLFSTLFYLDVPLSAQALTAFCLLRRGRWLAGTLFLLLAVLIKENGLLLVPPYLLLLLLQKGADGGSWRPIARCAGVLVLLALAMGGMQASMRAQGMSYHPVRTFLNLVEHWKPNPAPPVVVPPSDPASSLPIASFDPRTYWMQPSHHPGDLRDPRNGVMYLGPVLLVALAASLFPAARRSPPAVSGELGFAWALATGLFYLVFAGLMVKDNPDVRFFLPGLAFLSLAAAAALGRWRWSPRLLPLLALAASLQTAAVLHKAWSLRRVHPAFRAVATFFEANARPGDVAFGYPEGNSRLLRVRLHWYLYSGLQRFWPKSPQERESILREEGVSWVLLDVRRVDSRPADDLHTGTVPSSFVREVAESARFRPVYSNSVYRVFRLVDPTAAASPK